MRPRKRIKSRPSKPISTLEQNKILINHFTDVMKDSDFIQFIPIDVDIDNFSSFFPSGIVYTHSRELKEDKIDEIIQNVVPRRELLRMHELQ